MYLVQHCPNVSRRARSSLASAMVWRLTSIGSRPSRSCRRHSSARWRASSKPTAQPPAAGPSPLSRCLLVIRSRQRNTQLLPFGFTSRYRPPPSPYRPGLLLFLTVIAVSRLESRIRKPPLGSLHDRMTVEELQRTRKTELERETIAAQRIQGHRRLTANAGECTFTGHPLRQIRKTPRSGRFAYLAERVLWTNPPVRQIRPERIWTTAGRPRSARRGGVSPRDGVRNPRRRHATRHSIVRGVLRIWRRWVPLQRSKGRLRGPCFHPYRTNLRTCRYPSR